MLVIVSYVFVLFIFNWFVLWGEDMMWGYDVGKKILVINGIVFGGKLGSWVL